MTALATEPTTQDVTKAQMTPDTDTTTAGSDGGASQIVSFRLANEEYGVDIMRIQEIILPGQITRMPQVPDFICGLINLRGHVIPIVDLRRRFKLTAADRDDDTRIIVANVGERTIGMVVDAVNEVLRINSKQVEPPPSSVAGIDHDYITGLVKFEDRILILLDIQSILSEQEQSALGKSQGTDSGAGEN
jgi:purine-binding chemotaxis protein CheW